MPARQSFDDVKDRTGPMWREPEDMWPAVMCYPNELKSPYDST